MLCNPVGELFLVREPAFGRVRMVREVVHASVKCGGAIGGQQDGVDKGSAFECWLRDRHTEVGARELRAKQGSWGSTRVGLSMFKLSKASVQLVFCFGLSLEVCGTFRNEVGVNVGDCLHECRPVIEVVTEFLLQQIG